MLNHKSQLRFFFFPRNPLTLAENTGDLRPSFYGYYYF